MKFRNILMTLTILSSIASYAEDTKIVIIDESKRA